MPDQAAKVAAAEIEKLEKTPPFSPEGTVIRNYLDWLLAIRGRKRPRTILTWRMRGPCLTTRTTDSKSPSSACSSTSPCAGYAPRKPRPSRPSRPLPLPCRARRRARRQCCHRCATAQAEHGAVLCRPARRGQDVIGALDCRRARPDLCAHLPRRRARRSGDSRAPPAPTSARCQAGSFRDSRKLARPIRLCCSMRLTRSLRTSAVTRPRPCSKCWIPSRTMPSTITISKWMLISRRSFSSPPQMSKTASIPRCATGWRRLTCRVTPRRKRSRSPSAS